MNVSKQATQLVVCVGAALAWATATVGQQPPAPITPPPPTQTAPLPQAPPVNNERPAVSPPEPLYPTAPAEERQFVFEHVYNYKRMRYQPPVTIQPVIRDRATYATPEQALTAHVSAMQAGDYDWWLADWDEASRAFLIERMAVLKQTPAFWREAWARVLQGPVVLVERIDSGPFGPYVMLIYSVRDKGGKETVRSAFVARYENGRWVATQELAADPFFHHYESGQDRVSVTVR